MQSVDGDATSNVLGSGRLLIAAPRARSQSFYFDTFIGKQGSFELEHN